GIGAVVGPALEKKLGGKIKTIVATQSSSIIFLVLMGFSPLSWLAQIAFLARGVLMNIATPFYSAFAMEQIPPESQGAVNSMLNISWTLGWAVGPMISGIVQQRAGFTPLFIATTIIYSGAIVMTWFFFHDAELKNIKTERLVEALE
ncbi:MAG TPA: MFS transporter, partial [Anaerolineaceae bacterium]|nr:MFS transporter [Anaerolineaceae bacterium]